MRTRVKQKDIPSLSPFPEGWYFVERRQTLQKAGLIQKTWMGTEIVAWWAGGGRVCVAESVCPHLGSALGPATGGKVQDGCLVCPFHGFEYDATGQCVATPFAAAPKSAKLRVFETREVLDLIFAWWGSGGRPPQWDLPADPPVGSDWSDLEIRTIRFPGHPQETSENSVDLSHLNYVHGFRSVNQVGSVSADGPHLRSCVEFRVLRTIAGILPLSFDILSTTHVVGLGYSLVEIHERSIGMYARLWALATPVDGTLVDFTLVGQMREMRKPKRPIVGLSFVPPRARARIMNKLLLSAELQAIEDDLVIWGSKTYIPRPRLCRSDVAIGMYRRYCQQFYPELYGGYRKDGRNSSPVPAEAHDTEIPRG